MLLPMLLLAAAAIGAGYLGNAPTGVLGIAADGLGIPAHWFAETLHHKAGDLHWGIIGLSSVVAVGGIGLATLMYLRGISLPAPVEAALRPLGTLLRNRYYLDHLYEGLLVRRIAYRGVFLAADWWDRRVVDGVADLTAWLGRNTGRALAQLQTGQAQAYGIAAALGRGGVHPGLTRWCGDAERRRLPARRRSAARGARRTERGRGAGHRARDGAGGVGADGGAVRGVRPGGGGLPVHGARGVGSVARDAVSAGDGRGERAAGVAERAIGGGGGAGVVAGGDAGAGRTSSGC